MEAMLQKDQKVQNSYQCGAYLMCRSFKVTLEPQHGVWTAHCVGVWSWVALTSIFIELLSIDFNNGNTFNLVKPVTFRATHSWRPMRKHESLAPAAAHPNRLQAQYLSGTRRPQFHWDRIFPEDLRSKTCVASMLARAFREPFKSFGEQARPAKVPDGLPIGASIV